MIDDVSNAKPRTLRYSSDGKNVGCRSLEQHIKYAWLCSHNTNRCAEKLTSVENVHGVASRKWVLGCCSRAFAGGATQHPVGWSLRWCSTRPARASPRCPWGQPAPQPAFFSQFCHREMLLSRIFSFLLILFLFIISRHPNT